MADIIGYECKVFIKNSYIVIKELKYNGYINDDGTVRLKSLVGRYYSQKLPLKSLGVDDSPKNKVA